MNGDTENKEYKDALKKKALGYDFEEVIEEYVAGESGEIKLAKKKVTKKNVPPDVTALKMLIEGDTPDLNELSDEELEKEKKRLLKLLAEQEKEKKSERKVNSKQKVKR